MDILESKIDRSSDEYKRNYETMAALVEDLKIMALTAPVMLFRKGSR